MHKSDILFINPHSSTKAYQSLSKDYSAKEPPTWALLLAQTCLKNNYKAHILDSDAERHSLDESLDSIKYLAPKICCFVLYGQNPNSGTTSMIGASELASAIKDSNINTKVLFVGSHVSSLPDEVLSEDFVDFVLINEGVYGLLDLLKTNLKDDLDKCQSLGYKIDGKNIFSKKSTLVPNDRMDIDLPGYAWELLPKDNHPLDKYRAHYWHSYFKHDNEKFVSIYSSLGCMFACNFCMINILNRTNLDDSTDASSFKGMRFWSPEFFLSELEVLHDLGVKHIRLADEMFFLNRKYYIPILQGIIDRGFNFNFWAYARVDTVREDQLELFKKAGVNWLALGIEAGSQTVRQSIEKGRFRDMNVREIVKLIKAYDINVLGNYIFGFPEDTLETMNETLDLALELNCEHANFYACQALPGSPLYTNAIKNNLEVPKKYEEFAFLSYECKPMPTNYVGAKEVLKFRDEAWHKYFENPNFLNLIENKFGETNKENVIKQSKIRLKRKILGD